MTLVAKDWSSRPLNSAPGRMGVLWGQDNTDVTEKHGTAPGRAENSKWECSVSDPSKAGSKEVKEWSVPWSLGRRAGQRGRSRRLAHGAALHSGLPSWVLTHRTGRNQAAKERRTVLNGPPYPQVQ